MKIELTDNEALLIIETLKSEKCRVRENENGVVQKEAKNPRLEEHAKRCIDLIEKIEARRNKRCLFPD